MWDPAAEEKLPILAEHRLSLSLSLSLPCLSVGSCCSIFRFLCSIQQIIVCPFVLFLLVIVLFVLFFFVIVLFVLFLLVIVLFVLFLLAIVLFVLLSFFFWLLYCLSFFFWLLYCLSFDLRFFITPLVSPILSQKMTKDVFRLSVRIQSFFLHDLITDFFLLCVAIRGERVEA